MPNEPASAGAEDLGLLVEETRVTPVKDFPPRVVAEILTADGKLSTFVFHPMHAHKFSDDMLRGVAEAKRKEEL